MKSIITYIAIVLAILIGSAVLHAQEVKELTPLSTALFMSKHLDRDSSNFSYYRSDIARVSCRFGNFDAALDLANDMERSDAVQLLLAVADCALEVKNKTVVTKALQNSLTLISSQNEDEELNPWLAPGLVERSLTNGEPDLALKFLAKIEPGYKKGQAVIKVIDAFIKSGDKKSAGEYLERIIEERESLDQIETDDLVELLSMIAVRFERIGLKEKSKEIARLVIETANQESSGNSWSGQFASTKIGMWSRLGDIDRAEYELEAADAEVKLGALLRLAIVASDQGDQNRSSSFLMKAQTLAFEGEPYEVSAKTANVVKTYVALNRGREAFELLKRISDDSYLRTAAIEIADWNYRNNQTADALLVLDLATKHASRIVSEKSEDIPGSASFSRAKSKSQTLGDLVEKFLEFGNPERAFGAAKAIDHPQYKADALARVALGFARNGDETRAKKILSEAYQYSTKSADYNHDWQREYSMHQLTRVSIEAGFDDFARKCFHRFLQELDSNSSASQYVPYLLELGLSIESHKLSVSEQSLSLLKKLKAEFEEDN